MARSPRPTALLELDSGSSAGVGHVMRSLTLARELSASGWEIALARDLRVPSWLQPLLELFDAHVDSFDRGMPPDLLLVDSYRADPDLLRQARSKGTYVVALVDGATMGYEADLYIDQNYGAQPRPEGLPGATWLVGSKYALVRSSILALRPLREPLDTRDRPHVLAYFGGTDPARIAPYALDRLAELPDTFSLTLVSVDRNTQQTANHLAAMSRRPFLGLPPTASLDPLMATADIVICASGTSLWDLMTLGKSIAVTTTSVNQEPIVARLQIDGIVTSLGAAHEWTTQGWDSLIRLLGHPDERTQLARRAWRTVDGQGARRIAEHINSVLLHRCDGCGP